MAVEIVGHDIDVAVAVDAAAAARAVVVVVVGRDGVAVVLM